MRTNVLHMPELLRAVGRICVSIHSKRDRKHILTVQICEMLDIIDHVLLSNVIADKKIFALETTNHPRDI